jgi:hypothetical protein
VDVHPVAGGRELGKNRDGLIYVTVPSNQERDVAISRARVMSRPRAVRPSLAAPRPGAGANSCPRASSPPALARSGLGAVFLSPH